MKPAWSWQSALLIVVVIWLIYISIMVAKHVDAWPFN
jgi:hypothetical protein